MEKAESVASLEQRKKELEANTARLKIKIRETENDLGLYLKMLRDCQREKMTIIASLSRLMPKPVGLFRKSCPQCGERLTVETQRESVEKYDENTVKAVGLVIVYLYRLYRCRCGYNYLKPSSSSFVDTRRPEFN